MSLIVSHEVDSIRAVGADEQADLVATVHFNIKRDAADPHGDNLSIHVRLPPGAENTTFGRL